MPLHERRIRGDLIQLFKFNNGFNEVSWVNPLVQCSLRVPILKYNLFENGIEQIQLVPNISIY